MPGVVPPAVEARHGGVPGLHIAMVGLSMALGQELSGERVHSRDGTTRLLNHVPYPRVVFSTGGQRPRIHVDRNARMVGDIFWVYLARVRRLRVPTIRSHTGLENIITARHSKNRIETKEGQDVLRAASPFGNAF